MLDVLVFDNSRAGMRRAASRPQASLASKKNETVGFESALDDQIS